MKKLSLIILSTLFFILCPAVSVHAEGDRVYNPYGLEIVPNAYYYNAAWWTLPPSTPGAIYYYNGVKYTVGGQTTSTQQSVPTQTYQQQYYQPAQQYYQPTQYCQPAQQPVQQQQIAKPYYYDGAWRETMPTTPSTKYWYNGVWYQTAAAVQPAPVQVVQRPSAYVDNAASAKAQSLVDYARTNGVAGSYTDTTDSATVAQKHLSFSGSHGAFDMTLTTQTGSDGRYVTKYWQAGIERTESEIQGMILWCR